MAKKTQKHTKRSFEQGALVLISVVFVAVIVSAWIYAVKLRQSIAAGDNVTSVSSQALIDLEKLRHTIESQIDNSRTFFLLGSKSLYDDRKKDRDLLNESLENFEKQYTLPQIPPIIKRMEGLDREHQEVFDQGMKFREKNTESKIVGQFYQSKIKSIHDNLNEALDEIAGLETAAILQARTHAREAAHGAEVRIPSHRRKRCAGGSVLTTLRDWPNLMPKVSSEVTSKGFFLAFMMSGNLT